MNNNRMRKNSLYLRDMSFRYLAGCNEQANQSRKEQRIGEAIEILTDCRKQNADRLAILRVIPLLPLLLVAALG